MDRSPKTKKMIAAAKAYKKIVCDNSGDVDPQDEYHWFGLALGFFLGYGLTLDEAHLLSRWVSFDTGDFKAPGWENWPA
jgi:hypothetical protein